MSLNKANYSGHLNLGQFCAAYYGGSEDETADIAEQVSMDTLESLKQALIEKDGQTIDVHVQRLAEVGDLTYDGVFSPTREYLEELDKLYVDGHFMATIIFACSIVEYLLRTRLFLVADDRASLSKLLNIARRRKLLSKNEVERLLMVKAIRNVLVHTGADSDFAQELMDAAYSDVTYDPYVQRAWFFSGSNFSLMAKTCAEIARGFAAEECGDRLREDSQ